MSITCSDCKNAVEGGNIINCMNCNALICESCADRERMVCPFCGERLYKNS